MLPITKPEGVLPCNPLQLALGRSLYAPAWRFYAKLAKRHLQFDRSQPSTLKLDVVTPLAEKDLPMFYFSVPSIREHLLHPIGQHYLVGRDSPKMRDAARAMSCTFVDELEVCPEGLAAYKKAIEGTSCNRVGWFYQQMLKLNMNQICESGRFITVDADTVFINPVRYELNNQIIFDISDGYRRDFDYLLDILLPAERRSPFSFMCHIMIMENECLQQLQQHIERVTGHEWRQGIMKSIDYERPEYYSEFELYANFVLNRWPQRYTRSYWFNREISCEFMADTDRFKQDSRKRFKTLSFHVRKLPRNPKQDSGVSGDCR